MFPPELMEQSVLPGFPRQATLSFAESIQTMQSGAWTLILRSGTLAIEEDKAIDMIVVRAVIESGALRLSGKYEESVGQWIYRLDLAKPPCNFLIDLAERWQACRGFESGFAPELRATLSLDTLLVANLIDLSALTCGL